MAEDNFRTTNLWRSSLAEVIGDPLEEQRTRLRASLMACRAKVKPIVERIAQILPGLTVHDVSHLDALWGIADLIAGPDYPLNPLEAYIFGLSVLFHDSAMCWDAYENGRDGVRETIEWKDAYAHECDVSPEGIPDAERRSAADFAALRALHAHQAARLPEISWRHPDTAQEIFLIDDADLRTDIGPLAGKIAASHHWDIDALSSALGEQFNAPFPFPTEWSVDPVKIACLLRCADAAHINSARAPLFLCALVKRQGVSLEHWRAQNRMMGPSLDAGDSTGSSVIYTSARAFKEADAAAWWIAHDAVLTVAQEIHASNELLRCRNRQLTPQFAVKQVKGSESIDELIRHLRVKGWMPCNAKPHVSNVESLVKQLGGEKLYGEGSPAHVFSVVLRELIQNARDAVVARQFIDTGFDGEIHVNLFNDGQEQWVCVEDNGIGMSRRVMTGPLLDFGNSFWKSSLVQSEFPGLRSSRFRSIGRFGIGFYSVFMVGDHVEVASRAWDQGLDEFNTLVFTSGVSLRPILRRGRPSRTISSRTSTSVRIKVKAGLITPEGVIAIKPSFMGAEDIHCDFGDFVAALAVGLDVRVSVSGPGRASTKIHRGQPEWPGATKELLSRICFLSSRDAPSVADYIEKNHSRLRPIQMEDQIYGVAAISTAQDSAPALLGINTVGGLPASIQGGYSSSFIGYIDYKPGSARRDTKGFEAPQEVIRQWAEEQLRILEQAGATDFERCAAGAFAADFFCDPIDFAKVLVFVDGNISFVSYSELAALAEKQPVGILKTAGFDHIEIHHSVQGVNGLVLIRPLVNGSSCTLKMFEGKPSDAKSIIGCLHRAIESKNRNPNWEQQQTHLKSNFHQPLELLLVRSQEI